MTHCSCDNVTPPPFQNPLKLRTPDFKINSGMFKKSKSSSDTTFEVVEREMSRELSDTHITFTYPPHALSAHSQSWATASEIAVEAKHLAYNLNQIVDGASIEEEFEDIPSDAAGSSGANI
jgi:hypothetical protein